MSDMTEEEMEQVREFHKHRHVLTSFSNFFDAGVAYGKKVQIEKDAKLIEEHVAQIRKNIDEFYFSPAKMDAHDRSDFGKLHAYPENCQMMSVHDAPNFIRNQEK